MSKIIVCDGCGKSLEANDAAMLSGKNEFEFELPERTIFTNSRKVGQYQKTTPKELQVTLRPEVACVGNPVDLCNACMEFIIRSTLETTTTLRRTTE